MAAPTSIKLTPTPLGNVQQNGNGQTQNAPVFQTRTRNIGGPTTYNPESGLVEKVPGGWTGKEGTPEKPTAPTGEQQGTKTPTRQEQWKTDQAKKKADQEAKANKTAAEKQALAKDHLKKGDLVGAAKALGMSPAEFREYAQNALLTVPTPDKELTPEQKRDADEKAFREEVTAFKQQQEKFQQDTLKANYIRDNVRPHIADPEKYEFIHSRIADGQDMEAYIYDFMNAHYVKTGGEILKASDVADTIEEQLEKAYAAQVDRGRKIKKAAKYYAAVEEQPGDPVVDEQVRSAVREPQFRDQRLLSRPDNEQVASRFPLQGDPEQEEQPEERPTPRVRPTRAHIDRSNGSRVPFALLPKEERMALIRSGR